MRPFVSVADFHPRGHRSHGLAHMAGPRVPSGWTEQLRISFLSRNRPNLHAWYGRDIFSLLVSKCHKVVLLVTGPFEPCNCPLLQEHLKGSPLYPGPIGLLWQNTTHWATYKQHTCISPTSGGWTSKAPADFWSVGSCLFAVSSQGGKGRRRSL